MHSIGMGIRPVTLRGRGHSLIVSGKEVWVRWEWMREPVAENGYKVRSVRLSTKGTARKGAVLAQRPQYWRRMTGAGGERERIDALDSA